MSRSTRAAGLASLCAVALMTAACGGGDGSSEADDANTITWWHNSNNEPGKGYYEQVAKDFEADHPGVDVEVSAMAHEDMVDKLDAAFQSGDVPDIYMERGGGELADHVEAGLIRDLSEDAAEEIEKLGGCVAGWQVGRQDLRAAVLRRRRRCLVQQGPLRGGRRLRTPDHDGRVVRRDRTAQGRWHHPDLRRRGRQVAGRPLLVLHRAALVPAGRPRGRRDEPRLLRPVLRRGRRGARGRGGRRAVQRGVPDHAGAGGCDLGVRPAGHRQGRDGAGRATGSPA